MVAPDVWSAASSSLCDGEVVSYLRLAGASLPPRFTLWSYVSWTGWSMPMTRPKVSQRDHVAVVSACSLATRPLPDFSDGTLTFFGNGFTTLSVRSTRASGISLSPNIVFLFLALGHRLLLYHPWKGLSMKNNTGLSLSFYWSSQSHQIEASIDTKIAFKELVIYNQGRLYRSELLTEFTKERGFGCNDYLWFQRSHVHQIKQRGNHLRYCDS